MPGSPIQLGPFTEGLHNSAGIGEYIKDKELFEVVNLEVDTDGSLANRPAIYEFALDDSDILEYRTIGAYYLEDGTAFLVLAYRKASTYGVGLFNSETGAKAGSKEGFTAFCSCGIQYYKKYYVYPKPGTADIGGYFDDTLNWTEKALPGGQAAECAIYNERMFATAGDEATNNKSRLYFSAPGDPTSFTGTDYIDIEPGNGQSLIGVVLNTNNLILFKENSTYRLTFTSNIEKVQVINLSTTIGASRSNCAVVYGNGSLYVLSGDAVYEMYNFNFSQISTNLRFDNEGTSHLSPTVKLRSLTLFRDRLFVRYNSRMYVYSLLSGKWSSWETENNFREVVSVYKDGGDKSIAFAASINKDDGLKKMFTFRDDRLDSVGSKENFICRITTKTYDFDLSYTYKVMFWWGMTIATLGDTRAKVISDNAGRGYLWEELGQFTWQQLLDMKIKWSSASPVIQSTTVPADIGEYSRKFLKFPRKVRFRQAYFQIETDAAFNEVGDASVRIYDVSVFIKSKETLVKRTTA